MPFQNTCNGRQTYGFHIPEEIFIVQDVLSDFSKPNVISGPDHVDHSPFLFLSEESASASTIGSSLNSPKFSPGGEGTSGVLCTDLVS